MKKITRRILIFVGIGNVFPIIYILGYNLGKILQFPMWGFIIWPSAILLMATDGAEHDIPTVITVLGISLIVNALLWGLAGWLLITVVHYLNRKIDAT